MDSTTIRELGSDTVYLSRIKRARYRLSVEDGDHNMIRIKEGTQNNLHQVSVPSQDISVLGARHRVVSKLNTG